MKELKPMTKASSIFHFSHSWYFSTVATSLFKYVANLLYFYIVEKVSQRFHVDIPKQTERIEKILMDIIMVCTTLSYHQRTKGNITRL